MPTYDYRCEKCGSVFEITHGFDEKPSQTCLAEGCDGTLRRVFSPPTIIFKGSGWHVTDYGRGNGPANGRGNGRGNGRRNGARNGGGPSQTPEKATDTAQESAESGE